jgi:integrase
MTRSILAKRPRTKSGKPSKPRKDFPLFPHDSGQWAKKVRGKLFYFGKWENPKAAEDKWNRDREALLDGRNPDDARHGDSIGWLCNVFMDSKQLQHDRGELTKRALGDYHRVCKHIAEFFGKGRRLESLRSPDIERYRASLPETWGPTTTNNHLRLARVVFKCGNDIEVTDRPIRYQIGLKAVPKSAVRKDQSAKAAKEFTAAEAWTLYEKASQPMRAFILLGLNAAYGTMDIARLRIDQIDFKGRWLGEPRGKTGMARGCWLWPETIKALREAIDNRPDTTNERLDALAFLTRNRRPWSVDGENIHPLAQAFKKAKDAVGIDKTGVGHYSLRHTFATVASDAGDQQAVDYVMGHHDPSMAALYREGIDPKRVEAVCKHVRKWFLAGKPKKKRTSRKGGAK